MTVAITADAVGKRQLEDAINQNLVIESSSFVSGKTLNVVIAEVIF